jgi:hypothetical protein
MRTRPFAIAASLTIVAAGFGSPARAADGYRHGYVRYVEAGATLQRATEVSAEEALANLPFLPGDRVWTDAQGRAEFQFPDGTLLRLDRRSKLDYSGHEEEREERIVLRLWSGSLVVRLRGRSTGHFQVETPAGIVEALDQAMVRVDVEAGETRVSVYRGAATLDDGRERVRLAAGERTFSRWGAAPEEPQPFDVAEEDDFATWDELRESEDRWAARSSEYLPDELDPYAGELERNGSWRFEGSVGYVWAPNVAAGWSPYGNGYWTWTPYGWTWVPNETWGWAPFHYGRWGFDASFGWYWAPGSTWGPGWVSWGVGNGYVGWCPLGRGDRAVSPWGWDQGHAVMRGGRYRNGGWNVVRQGDLGGRDLAHRRVALSGLAPEAFRAADGADLRPTRDARALRPNHVTSQAISRRPTAGDFVRELGVDNKTTIPAPWTRGYGPPPAGVDGARYGARRPETPPDNGARESQRTTGATRRGTPAEATTATPQSTQESTARRAPRPAPWYAPRATETGSGGRGASAPPASAPPASASGAQRRGQGTSSESAGSGSRVRSGGESSGYRQRGGGEDSGGARPRAERSAPRPPRDEGAGSSARPSGGGGGSAARPSGGSGSSARPSGGKTQSSSRSGGGHASPRPPR